MQNINGPYGSAEKLTWDEHFFESARWASERLLKEESNKSSITPNEHIWNQTILAGFAIEQIIRFCIAKVSPAFLAEDNEKASKFFFAGVGQKMSINDAKTMSISKTFDLVQLMYPNLENHEITQVQTDFRTVMNARNAAAHTGAVDGENWDEVFVGTLRTISLFLVVTDVEVGRFWGNRVAAVQHYIDSDRDSKLEMMNQYLKDRLTDGQNHISKIEKDKKESFKNSHDQKVVDPEMQFLVKCPACKIVDIVVDFELRNTLESEPENFHDVEFYEIKSKYASFARCTLCGFVADENRLNLIMELNSTLKSDLKEVELGRKWIGYDEFTKRKEEEFDNFGNEVEYRDMLPPAPFV